MKKVFLISRTRRSLARRTQREKEPKKLVREALEVKIALISFSSILLRNLEAQLRVIFCLSSFYGIFISID